MMKSSILFISLLLLHTLFHEARGARLISARLTPKAYEFVGSSKSTNIEVEDSNMGKESTGSVLGSGRNRKLVTKTSASASGSTTHTENIDKNDHENGNAVPNTEQAEGHSIKQGNADDDKVESIFVHYSSTMMTTTEQHGHDLQLLDVDEMDYSPARRKPPIHN